MDPRGPNCWKLTCKTSWFFFLLISSCIFFSPYLFLPFLPLVSVSTSFSVFLSHSFLILIILYFLLPSVLVVFLSLFFYLSDVILQNWCVCVSLSLSNHHILLSLDLSCCAFRRHSHWRVPWKSYLRLFLRSSFWMKANLHKRKNQKLIMRHRTQPLVTCTHSTNTCGLVTNLFAFYPFWSFLMQLKLTQHCCRSTRAHML